MAKYKIEFQGFVYVEADTPEEANQKYDDGDTVYEESFPSDPEEVESFEITI